MEKIILKRRDGELVKAALKVLDLNYIDKIMELQSDIYEKLENKDFYACSTRDEFISTINGKGRIIGYISLKDDELIAMSVYIEYGYDEHNYGYDIEIQGEELLKVGQIESMLVSEKYRGNRLQKRMGKRLETIGISLGKKYICATVAPNNVYSLNTFKELEYNIMAEKLKYGGLRRYVLMKEL